MKRTRLLFVAFILAPLPLFPQRLALQAQATPEHTQERVTDYSTQTEGHLKDEPAQEDDPVAILEVGASTNWNFSGGAATFAPNLAVECTPIENWLELEAGVSPFYSGNSTEWDTDFLFKKPWTISKTAEFMAGAGPQWAHLKRNGKTTDSFSAELAGDFMFWPTGKHRFGWYLEPAYDYSFAGGHQQSVGMSAGLLIVIR